MSGEKPKRNKKPIVIDRQKIKKENDTYLERERERERGGGGGGGEKMKEIAI